MLQLNEYGTEISRYLVMEGKHIGEQFVEKRGVDRKILGIQKFI
jgi:hypothetical protein